ncbi:MAG: hypothetical protein HUJ31_12660 [Pseudomonadales bacterium]|nr:hypothetical protein [Pseudomonadales bacterium]
MLEDRTVSRAALLDLRHERELIEQGHRFLDEKRMQLAREMLHRVEAYEMAIQELVQLSARGSAILSSAIDLYGLVDIEAYPSLIAEPGHWTHKDVWFLGLSLPESDLALKSSGLEAEPSASRPPAEDIGNLYQRATEQAVKVGAMLTALLRLESEYRRTERSVRALENVVMPEIRQEEKALEEALAELEQEEAVRVRLFDRQGDPGPKMRPGS